MLDEYKSWTTIKSFTGTVTSNKQWIEIKKSFVATKESYKFIFGVNNCSKADSFYLKDMFLIQGDYTNKKLPNNLFK